MFRNLALPARCRLSEQDDQLENPRYLEIADGVLDLVVVSFRGLLGALSNRTERRRARRLFDGLRGRTRLGAGRFLGLVLLGGRYGVDLVENLVIVLQMK